MTMRRGAHLREGSMTTEAKDKDPVVSSVQEELEELRSEWLIEEVAEGMRELERGEVRRIEIDEKKGEYRLV